MSARQRKRQQVLARKHQELRWLAARPELFGGVGIRVTARTRDYGNTLELEVHLAGGRRQFWGFTVDWLNKRRSREQFLARARELIANRAIGCN